MPSVGRPVPRRPRSGLSALLFAATLVAVAPPALAQPPSAGVSLADKAFVEGKKAVAEQRLGEACARFAESQRLDAQPGTLLYLATCHAEQGKTATAWSEYKDAEALAQRMGKSERVKEARARVADIEGKLARVQIQVARTPPDLVVRANGREIHELGAALPVDPGPLTIEASARGRVPWVTTIEVPSGPSNQVIVVPVLALLASNDAAEAARPALLASADAARSGRRAAERKARWIAAGTVGGVGVVGIVVGGAFGALASQQYKNAQSAGGCGDTSCTSYALFKPGYADARTSAYVSTAAFVAGGAALATGVILALTVPDDRAVVRLDAGPGPALALEGTF